MPEVLFAYAPNVPVAEQCLDPLSGVISMDDATFMTLLSCRVEFLRYLSLTAVPFFMQDPPNRLSTEGVSSYGCHWRPRYILRLSHCTQIIEQVRLPEDAQHKPTDSDELTIQP